MKVRSFQRTTEASFPENESLPKKEEDTKKFDKRFNEWWDDVKENLARLSDQMETYIKSDLTESIQANATDLSDRLVVATREIDTQLTSQATTAGTVEQRVSSLETLVNAHISATNNPHSVTPAQLSLHAIATSGEWADINNKPSTFPPSAHNHAISEISNLQTTLNGKANVADLFSGDYNDLTNKPTLFSGDYDDLTNKPTLFSGDYDDLTNKPTIPTVPGVATTSADGLMSSGDKTKLDGIPTGGSGVPVTFNGSNKGNLISITVSGGSSGYGVYKFSTASGSFAFSANVDQTDTTF